MKQLLFFLFCSAFLLLISCGNSVKPAKTPSPVLEGWVLDAADSSAIAQANVIVYDANTNAPVTRTFTNTSGFYSFELDTGTYYLKVSAQNFQPSPPPGLAALPFDMLTDDTTQRSIYLDSSTQTTSGGSISGTVTNLDFSGIGGVLITATDLTFTQAFSTTSGPHGFYIIYNVAPGSYYLQCYLAGYKQITCTTAVTVSAGVTNEKNDIILSPFTTATLSGQITFLASPNSVVDITCIHPITREAIPGLSTVNDTAGNKYQLTTIPLGTYQLTAIPPGSYIVWASYQNDGYVMDPDRILKFGLPKITVTEATTSLDKNFEVTDAVPIVSPSNDPDTIQPVLITTTHPTFVWEKYPSAKEYIIEVSNSHGTIIWGGFDSTIILHSQITAAQTSAAFNFDGSATDSLLIGETYRWKIYADKDAVQDIQGLISMSEGLLGLFRVVADTEEHYRK